MPAYPIGAPLLKPNGWANIPPKALSLFCAAEGRSFAVPSWHRHTFFEWAPPPAPPIRHFGIAAPWAWTLDPEMLDSGPILRPKNTQKLVHDIHLCSNICVFLGRYFQKYRSIVQHFRVQNTSPGYSDSRMPSHPHGWYQKIEVINAAICPHPWKLWLLSMSDKNCAITCKANCLWEWDESKSKATLANQVLHFTLI